MIFARKRLLKSLLRSSKVLSQKVLSKREEGGGRAGRSFGKIDVVKLIVRVGITMILLDLHKQFVGGLGSGVDHRIPCGRGAEVVQGGCRSVSERVRSFKKMLVIVCPVDTLPAVIHSESGGGKSSDILAAATQWCSDASHCLPPTKGVHHAPGDNEETQPSQSVSAWYGKVKPRVCTPNPTPQVLQQQVMYKPRKQKSAKVTAPTTAT